MTWVRMTHKREPRVNFQAAGINESAFFMKTIPLYMNIYFKKEDTVQYYSGFKGTSTLETFLTFI